MLNILHVCVFVSEQNQAKQAMPTQAPVHLIKHNTE